MLILTATRKTNGDLTGDYDFCVEGELVYLQEPCARDQDDPDGGCGCGRGFAGTSSHRATTTARVTDSPLAEPDVREAIRASLEAGGWLDPRFTQPGMSERLIDEVLEDIAAVTGHFPVGSVVRRRLWEFYAVEAA